MALGHDPTDDFREIVPIPDSPRGVPVELPHTTLAKDIDRPHVIGIRADQLAVAINGVRIPGEAPHLIPVANIRTMT
jgi:hypothetical protein